MQDFNHICSHPRCYKTENDCTMYEVESRRGDGSFTVCGSHLMERDIDRAEVIVTMKPAASANAEMMKSLKTK